MAILSQAKEKRPIRNIAGLEIRRLRENKGWSQSDLARALQLSGWDIERSVLTKIELKRRCLTDYELLLLAKTLGATLNDLVPKRPELDQFFSIRAEGPR